MLEQGGGANGHKARAGREVMGGRGFPFLGESRKCKAQSVPQTELLASRMRERAFGKLQRISAGIRKQPSGEAFGHFKMF